MCLLYIYESSTILFQFHIFFLTIKPGHRIALLILLILPTRENTHMLMLAKLNTTLTARTFYWSHRGLLEGIMLLEKGACIEKDTWLHLHIICLSFLLKLFMLFSVLAFHFTEIQNLTV